MDRVRSIFIGMFIALLSVSLLHACIALDLHGLAIGWLGVLVSSVSNLAFLYWLDARETVRSWTHFRLLLLLSALGALISLWGAIWPVPVIDRLPPWYSVTVLIGTALYAFWYARTGEAVGRLSSAKQSYQFLAGRDYAGATVVQHTAGGKSSQLLIIRSNLCPCCVAAHVLYLDDDGNSGTRRASRSLGESPSAGPVDGKTGMEGHAR